MPFQNRILPLCCKFMCELLNYVGFCRFGLFYRDVWFYVSIALAFLFYWVLSLFVSVHVGIVDAWQFLFYQAVFVVFPEELFFRGFLIPTLNRYVNIKISFISFGNLVSALIFAFFHLFSHPFVWAFSTFIPALIFGYFREKYNSIWPSAMLHFIYNAGYFYFFK